MFGECFFMPKIFCNARNLKINSETPWKILNNLFTLTTTFTEVFVSSRLPLLWVIELSSVFFIVVSQFREHQRKKWYETLAAGSESEMQPNLGLYWTRRRGTCIELLNKFTSFQFSSLGRAFRMLVFFSASPLAFCSSSTSISALITSSLFYYMAPAPSYAITFKLYTIHIWSPFILCESLILHRLLRFIYQDFLYVRFV